MKKLGTIIIGIIALATAWQVHYHTQNTVTTAQSFDETRDFTLSQNLNDISEVGSTLELADVGFYPEITNEPLNALEYNGNRKQAANLGVYIADFVYTHNTSELDDIHMNFAAIMELSEQVGINEGMFDIMYDRYENNNSSTEEILDMLHVAIDDSEKDFTETQKSQLYAYILMGNYIEKLHLTSSIIMRPKQTELPTEAEANLKRGLIQYVAQQSTQLEEMADLLASFEGDETDKLVRMEIEKLADKYKMIEANQNEIMSLPMDEMYQTEEVAELIGQIQNVREKIVS